MATGAPPAMAVSGAAAEMTKKATANTPRRPCRKLMRVTSDNVRRCRGWIGWWNRRWVTHECSIPRPVSASQTAAACGCRETPNRHLARWTTLLQIRLAVHPHRRGLVLALQRCGYAKSRGPLLLLRPRPPGRRYERLPVFPTAGCRLVAG